MNLPNKITITRIILVPFFIAAIVYGRMDIALVFFVLAVISDGIDGFIARTTNQKTELGTILDPLADKLLLVSAFICLAMVNPAVFPIRLPPYVPIIVISRDAILVIGALIVHVVTGNVKISPSAIGKITTFFQMMAIVSILIQFKGSYIIWNLAVLLTIISAVDYIMKGSRLFNENPFINKKAQ